MPAPGAEPPPASPRHTVGDLVALSTQHLTARGVASPRLDAELVVAEGLGLGRLDLYTGPERPVTPAERDAVRALLARRARHEPMAYILGRKGFRRLELAVTPDVLVPRPETELVVEWVVAHAPPGARVLDWGTGSGAIALALADERPDLAVTAVDVSEAALSVARANAARRRDGAADVDFVRSDGFAALAGTTFDLVVANPPYLSDAELAAAPPELAFEPAGALTAGPRGDEALARLCADVPAHLAPGGAVITEIGETQAAAVSQLMAQAGLTGIRVHRDLAGKPRAVSAVKQ